MYMETGEGVDRLTTSGRILRYIFRRQPVSRSEIARHLGLSPAMVTTVISSLIENNIINELEKSPDKESKASGRKRLMLGIRADAKYSIGVEIGIEHFRFCITDLSGNVLIQFSYVPTREQIINVNISIEQGVLKLIEDTGVPRDRVAGIGVALPGHLDPLDGHMVTLSSNWVNFNAHALEETLHMGVAAENNVRSMAYQKYLFDYKTCPENFVFIHVGAGIFCANFTAGQLTQGSYISGEIGHTISNPDGPRCECGKSGCLQTYASESWILQKIRTLYRTAPHSLLHGLVSSEDDITLETALAAYSLGDEIVTHIFHDAVRYLGIAIANISIIMNPQKLYLHSRMFQHTLLRDELQRYIESQLTFLDKHCTEEINILDFDSSRAAAGAAALAIDRLFIYRQP